MQRHRETSNSFGVSENIEEPYLPPMYDQLFDLQARQRPYVTLLESVALCDSQSPG